MNAPTTPTPVDVARAIEILYRVWVSCFDLTREDYEFLHPFARRSDEFPVDIVLRLTGHEKLAEAPTTEKGAFIRGLRMSARRVPVENPRRDQYGVRLEPAYLYLPPESTLSITPST